jgi:hypothetical protein
MTDLLAGKEITGEGCAAAGKAEEDGGDALPKDHKACTDEDLANIHA